jgi:hypothetical protein
MAKSKRLAVGHLEMAAMMLFMRTLLLLSILRGPTTAAAPHQAITFQLHDAAKADLSHLGYSRR